MTPEERARKIDEFMAEEHPIIPATPMIATPPTALTDGPHPIRRILAEIYLEATGVIPHVERKAPERIKPGCCEAGDAYVWAYALPDVPEWTLSIPPDGEMEIDYCPFCGRGLAGCADPQDFPRSE